MLILRLAMGKVLKEESNGNQRLKSVRLRIIGYANYTTLNCQD